MNEFLKSHIFGNLVFLNNNYFPMFQSSFLVNHRITDFSAPLPESIRVRIRLQFK